MVAPADSMSPLAYMRTRASTFEFVSIHAETWSELQAVMRAQSLTGGLLMSEVARLFGWNLADIVRQLKPAVTYDFVCFRADFDFGPYEFIHPHPLERP